MNWNDFSVFLVLWVVFVGTVILLTSLGLK